MEVLSDLAIAGGDLDGRDDPDPAARLATADRAGGRGRDRLRDAVDGVVVGECQQFDAGGSRRGDDLCRR